MAMTLVTWSRAALDTEYGIWPGIGRVEPAEDMFTIAPPFPLSTMPFATTYNEKAMCFALTFPQYV